MTTTRGKGAAPSSALSFSPRGPTPRGPRAEGARGAAGHARVTAGCPAAPGPGRPGTWAGLGLLVRPTLDRPADRPEPQPASTKARVEMAERSGRGSQSSNGPPGLRCGPAPTTDPRGGLPLVAVAIMLKSGWPRGGVVRNDSTCRLQSVVVAATREEGWV